MVTSDYTDEYDRVAHVYAELRAPQKLAREMEWFDTRRHETVLDAGCGPGRDIGSLAAGGAFVIGVDQSTKMLSIADSTNRNLIDSGRSKLLRADLTALPLREAGVHKIWCSTVLPHFNIQRLQLVMSGFCRALVPGGQIICTIKLGDYEGFEIEPLLDGARRFVKYWNFDDFDELSQRAGFIREDVYFWNEKTRFPSIGRDLNFASIVFRSASLYRRR